ncbi:MAG TPA: pyruvate dehydrogenase (acetyl-transferring) E1 component subunit alpha, partial [Sneathiellales bacterium]|nr:pyruvate dehydrogenase (acetyl-transferring) E1 component subunit alpha [Sneathiellales bacterium]
MAPEDTSSKSTPSDVTPGGANVSANLNEAGQLLSHYREMLMIRRFEEKAGQMYGMGLIGGFCHLYIGQEAVVVGINAAMGPNDSVITSYRQHGHLIARGVDAKVVMAELTGRV